MLSFVGRRVILFAYPILHLWWLPRRHSCHWIVNGFLKKGAPHLHPAYLTSLRDAKSKIQSTIHCSIFFTMKTICAKFVDMRLKHTETPTKLETLHIRPSFDHFPEKPWVSFLDRAFCFPVQPSGPGMQKVQLERRWHGLEGFLELDRGLHLAKMRDFRLCILPCFLALIINPMNILAW